MINIIRKTKQTPLDVVKEIHGKVLTSGDACLDAAKAILNDADANISVLHEEMAKRGFSNTKEIKEKQEALKVKALARAQADVISGYAIRYPHKKFISTEEMDKICTEYNLLLGADQHYTGSMPERTMREIVDFKLQPEDETYHIGKWRTIEGKMNFDKTNGVIDWSEITKEQYMAGTKNGAVLTSHDKRTHYISNKDYFYVAAPESMFNMEGLVKEGNYLKAVVEVDDPVCLKPVRYGYIIVAVWGEEIAIEKMKNPTLN